MIPQPVKRYRTPGYPVRLEVLADPDLLLRNVPANWGRNAVLMGALAAFLATGAWARADGDEGKAKPNAAIVAPVFEHGEGRGATGCVAVAPPSFLSEEEALVVITEELTKAGLKVTGKNVVLEGVTIPQRLELLQRDGDNWKREVQVVPDKAEPLVVDLVDGNRGIGVEYVAESDYLPLGGVRSNSTVQGYDFRGVATEVAARVREQATGIRFGIFYDPMVKIGRDWRLHGKDQKDWAAAWQKARDEAQAESKRLLRLQVKDFVDWLKGQGAI